jgi:hypothetical protein
MRMGNYMRVHRIDIIVMAARSPQVGIRHLTVVPTNFEPGIEAERADDESDSNSETAEH